jgi:PAS domain-containing protein
MRQLAQKKANMLVKTMPSAVVIVDNNMRIIESNRNFARIAGKEAEQVFEVKEGMEGAVLDKVLPISHLFRRVFETGTEIVDLDVRVGAKILRCSLFVIEPQLIAGCILNDVTKPSMKKEEIIKGTRQVIKRNLTTVQKIARLLGENAAETEMTLTQIIDAFKAGNTGNQK